MYKLYSIYIHYSYHTHIHRHMTDYINTSELIHPNDTEQMDEKILCIPESNKKTRKLSLPIEKYYSEDSTILEIGIDEVGRGPLFGRVYTAAVVLPKTKDLQYSLMKDSKKFNSKKKIDESAEYIKEHAIAWTVQYEDESIVDNINILQATQHSMHKCIDDILRQLKEKKIIYTDDKNNKDNQIKLLVDGNYFNPYIRLSPITGRIEQLNHICVEGGDNKYAVIAAASILAKVTRDKYIDDLCSEYPYLAEHYSIDTNKGYGAKKHIDGIKEHGITQWHRKSFGICRLYS